jgi:uncharacterized membrane protein YdjX (TVP38/TMEM64 family)
MPVLMFGAIAGCGLAFYFVYRYVRSQSLARKDQESLKEIAKDDRTNLR